MAERLANLGYLGLVKEATPGVALTPTDFIPLYDETLGTNMNFVDQQPIFGNKFATYATLQGLRSHKGDVTVMAEPNTTAKLFDALLTKVSSATTYTFTVTSANATVGATYTNNSVTFTVTATIAAQTTLIATGTGAPAASGTLTKASGTGDATITFSAAVAGNTTHSFGVINDSNSYTWDISTGNVVSRYFGVKASKITPTWNKTEMQWKVSISALGSFQGRALASTPTGSGPYTVVLDTTYDPNPTTGLVVGDLIRFYHAPGTTIDATVASVTNGTTITTTTNVTSMVQGDMVYLRPATVAFTVLPTFIWPKTQFKFGTTAALALAATQFRVEQGSVFETIHSFESDDGAPRSGGFDPASLVRTTGDATLKVKKFFDTPDDIATMNSLTKTALVISHLAGATNQYECRVTFNHLTTDGTIVPNIKSKDIAYSEIDFHPDYDLTDGQAYAVQVTNALTTI
jgi:hypothetical protein